MTSNRPPCSLIRCGQDPGPVPVDRLVESARIHYAAPATWIGTDLFSRTIYCCDDCKASLDHCGLAWTKLATTAAA